eukprot:GHVQ01001314.1.p1 GENE.GHVQ01001314.1~~GHVQ01001314.1.p1  ORF type:complete len:528 (-),score=94.90 GHVQ01001314.1:198-1781(-)
MQKPPQTSSLYLPSTQHGGVQRHHRGGYSTLEGGSGLPPGRYTETVYGLMRDEMYDEAIKYLSIENQKFPNSRCILSLLGYAYYYKEDYQNAASVYGSLVKVCPEIEAYRLYHAQSLGGCGSYEQALRTCSVLMESRSCGGEGGGGDDGCVGGDNGSRIEPLYNSTESPVNRPRLVLYSATLQYSLQDYNTTRLLIDECEQLCSNQSPHPSPTNSAAVAAVPAAGSTRVLPSSISWPADSALSEILVSALILRACVEWREGHVIAAKELFVYALERVGLDAQILASLAVCCYATQDYMTALKHVMEIIDKAMAEHPELGGGSNGGENGDVRSVGNSSVLAETSLIEAFNLKAAIEFVLQNPQGAKEALQDMPYRREAELDSVSLHNQALINMDAHPNEGFRKLYFLLQNPPFPPQTFVNLLILYCKYCYYDLAADMQAENAHLAAQCLDKEDSDFLSALIMAQSAPEQAFHSFESIATRQVEVLRRITKHIQDARRTRDNSAVKKNLSEFDTALDKYIPVSIKSKCY